MREHPEEYKPFMSVNTGGGHRRNPKRKNVASTFIATGPTEAEIDANFEKHLVRMSQDGTFGDNHEIRAFTKAYNTDVVIFSHSNTNFNCTAGDSDEERQRAYIALHVSFLFPLHLHFPTY
jgi:OTU domain-containing protein 3